MEQNAHSAEVFVLPGRDSWREERAIVHGWFSRLFYGGSASEYIISCLFKVFVFPLLHVCLRKKNRRKVFAPESFKGCRSGSV